MNSERLKERLYFIDKIPLLKRLNNIQKTNLAKLINLIEFKDKEKILTIDEKRDFTYIIKEGTVSCNFENGEIRKLGAMDFFGNNANLFDYKKTLDVISLGESNCYFFSKEILIVALGDSYNEEILFSIFKYVLGNYSFFSEIFSESQIEEIFKFFNIKKYNNKEIIYSAGIKHRKIMILIQGNLINVIFLIYFSQKLWILWPQKVLYMEMT